jgi:ABC-type antimicrobial peptide transport system permease subunit
MALGAGQGIVLRLVMREMVLVILVGVAAGVSTGLLCGRYIESQLFGVKAADLTIFALSASVVLATSLGAACLPSWRASRLDPVAALRGD